MKKIVSIIIAMTLILGLCPQIFAADTGDAFDGYEYIFTAEAQGKSDTVSSGFSDTYDNIDEDISDEWAKPARYYVIKDYLYPKKNVAEKGGLAFPFGTERLATGEFWAGVKINVENAGTYKPELKYFASKAAPIVDVYLIKAGTSSNGVSAEVALKASTNDGKVAVFNYLKALPDTYIVANDVNMWNDEKLEKTYDFDGGVWTLEAGDYYLYFKSVGNDNNFEAADLQTEYGGNTRTIAVLGLNSFSLTPVTEEDSELEEAFDAEIDEIEYTAPTVTGVTVDGGVIKSSESDDGTFTLTADAEKDGNKFLYWAKGKTIGKKIISFSNELTNYMPEANDKNHILIAVYEGDVPEQEEWYNANGQRIATGTEPDTYPSMAGYGEAEGWEDYSDKIHVARYALEEPAANIDITVEKGSGSGRYAYGDAVTCTADEETYGNFKCWTKTGINGNTEIVSVDEVYTFRAWETCTVEAIYQDEYTYNGNTMKIILDAFDAGNEKAVMAEFIGFGNSAVEKGIIWNGTKIAMTKPGTQFTLTGNAGDTFTGYAIVDNGDGTHSEVTDGSITIAE